MVSRIAAKDVPPLLEAMLAALKVRQDEIDKLNVFPVPDGDTGTNLVLTMQTVCEEVSKASDKSMAGLCKAATQGSLMGARGNSGVILSQIARGFCEVAGSKDILMVPDVVLGLKKAAKVARTAIRKPVEGTMLTTIKDIADAAAKLAKKSEDLDGLVEAILQVAHESVERTPELLDVLKEAGVVDAGALGLEVLAQGILSSLRGEEVVEVAAAEMAMPSVYEEPSLEYAYCTEFLLKSDGVEIPWLEKKLEKMGDSVMVVGTKELTKIHVHTNEPNRALELGVKLGSISQININNMWEQAEKRTRELRKAQPKGKVGVVAVASGDGIKTILESLGVERIVNGGQSMNPSTAQLLEAVKSLSQSEIIILPNNKNIIMTAEAVDELTDKKVKVVPTTTIPESFSALLAYNLESSLKKNTEGMKEAIKEVKTGEITFAIRDSQSEVGKIKKNDLIGLYNHQVKVVGKTLGKTASRLINLMLEEDDEVVTLLTGADISREEADKLVKKISQDYPNLEIEHHHGGQPLYHLIIGIE